MSKHATEQASVLLRRLAFQANRTSRQQDAVAVHDLRVSVRRLTQCLKVFSQFFPGGTAKKVRQKLDGWMDLASEVRNRDIAIELLGKAAIPPGSPVVRKLMQEREAAERVLVAALKRWSRRGIHKKWCSRLDL